MLKKLMISALLLSVVVLLAAAFVSPAQLQNWLANNNPSTADLETEGKTQPETKHWCQMMEEKPNQQWREGEFQRFASECLE